jgi:DnaJ-class molecular chaperone
LQLKLPGHGMPIDNTGQYGDQIIVLNPYMPDTISDAITQSILQNRTN